MKIITSSLKSGLKISWALKLSDFKITNLKPLSASRFMCYELKKRDNLNNDNYKVNCTSVYLKSIVMENPSYLDIRLIEGLLQENAKSKNDLVVFLRNLNGNEESNCTIDKALIDKSQCIDFTLLDLIETCHILFKNRKLLGQEVRINFFDLLKKKGYNIVGEKSSSRVLVFINLMSQINGKYISNVLLTYVLRHYNKLTRTELVFLFYALKFGKVKLCPEIKFAFSNFMSELLPKLNMDELTIVAHGCFRSELRLNKNVGEIMLSRLEENIENLNDVQVGEISKYVEYIGDYWDPEMVLRLHEKVLLIHNKFNVTSLTHLANIRHLGNSVNPKLLEILVDKFTDEENPRMKDLERFLLLRLYVTSEIEDPKFLNFVMEKLSSNKDNILEFPRSFVSLMNYLVYREIYMDDLIDYLFSENFLKCLYEKHPRYNGYELCSIDCCLELERPDYTGNRFDVNKRNQLLRNNHFRVFSPRVGEIFSQDVKNQLNQIFGYECAIVINALPHLPCLRAAISLDENYRPLEAKNLNLDLKIGHMIKFKENKWLIFVFVSEKCRPDGVNLNLFTQTRIRLLRATGLTTIESKMDLTVWNSMEPGTKKKYLCGLMNEALNVRLPEFDKWLDESKSSRWSV